MRLLLVVITGLLLPFILGAVVAFNPPTHELPGAESQSMLQAAQYPSLIEALSVVDLSRPTPASGDFEGENYRELNGKIWMPDLQGKAFSKPFPLVIYSHGFLSFHEESDYLGKFLAERGYVMVSFDYPATSLYSEGEPNLADIGSQPGDISFIIDHIIARSQDADDSLFGLIDTNKIASVGLSLGGLTTTLATYHKELRDDRIGAAVSIAGPVDFFTKVYFETTDTPLLYIAGDIDAMIDYDANALTLKDKIDNATIVTVVNASHTGFADIAEEMFRWLDNPDNVGCSFLMDNLERSRENPFAALGGEEVGIDYGESRPLPCQNMPLPTSINPIDQLLLTKVSVYSFLETQFAEEKDASYHERFLNVTFAEENESIKVR